MNVLERKIHERLEELEKEAEKLEDRLKDNKALYEALKELLTSNGKKPPPKRLAVVKSKKKELPLPPAAKKVLESAVPPEHAEEVFEIIRDLGTSKEDSVESKVIMRRFFAEIRPGDKRDEEAKHKAFSAVLSKLWNCGAYKLLRRMQDPGYAGRKYVYWVVPSTTPRKDFKHGPDAWGAKS